MIEEDDAQESPLKQLSINATAPANAVGVIGGQVVFSTVVNPAPSGYRWQIQMDGITWINLVETAGFYEGVTTNTLTVKSLDHFLANLTTRKFRCVAFNPNVPSFPTFTTPATLTIAKYLNFITGYGGVSAEQVNGIAPNFGALPCIGYGFTPTNFLWAYVSGDAGFTCLNPTLPTPSFEHSALNPGIFSAYWQCTASDGVTTLTTDPIRIVMCVTTGVPIALIDEIISENGTAFTQIPYNGYAAQTVQQRVRVGATPTISVTIDPTTGANVFPLSGAYPGGTMILRYLDCAPFDYCSRVAIYRGDA